MATNKPRFSVMFTNDAYKKIKKYQKENGISTQSKAVARLVEIAINEIESKVNNELLTAEEVTPRDALVSIEQQYGRNTRRALSMYIQLDQDDQGEIRGEMKQMLKDDKYKSTPCSKGDSAKVS